MRSDPVVEQARRGICSRCLPAVPEGLGRHSKLKTECFGGSIPPTKKAAKLMIFDYIETF